MSSPKSRSALVRLGQDIRSARLRRGIAIRDMAARSGVSPSTVARLEKGDAGVGVGALADILVVLGLSETLADLFDVRNDNLGLALTEERVPKRGKTFAAIARRQQISAVRTAATKSVSDGAEQAKSKAAADVVDPDGVSF